MADSFLLLEDGVSYLLLEDGVSKLILETGPQLVTKTYKYIVINVCITLIVASAVMVMP
jgi:hypothetical protein